MNMAETIEGLGYRPNEAKVYLAALNMGECTVSDIAGRVRLPRTSVQAVLDKLHTDGVMSSYTKRRYKYWIAESPERLLAKFREREEALLSVLPQLRALSKKGEGKPVVKVFSGREEIKFIHEDMLASRHHILALIPWDDWVKLFGREYMESFIRTRTQRFLQMRLVAPRSRISEELKSRDERENRTTRFLPPSIDIRDSIFIYADKVAIVSLNRVQPTGILIEDPDTRRTMTVFLEQAWKHSQE